MPSIILPVTQGSEPTPDQPVNIADLLPANVDVVFDDWQPNQVTGADVITAVAAVAIAVVLGYLINHFLRWSLRRWSSVPPFGADLAGRLAMYLTILVGIVIGLESVGLTLGPLVIIVAALVMAFWAMRPLLQNTGAGLVLQARGPFQPGQEIQSGGFEGEVEELDARVVTIRTPDGKRVYIPNQEVVEQPIVNLTELGTRRSTFDVGVAYETDLDEAVVVVRQALAGADGVLSEPPPQAFVHAFDESNITISAWFWHAPEIFTSWRVKDEATRATVRALRGAGMEISFPRRTLDWAEEPTTTRGQ